MSMNVLKNTLVQLVVDGVFFLTTCEDNLFFEENPAAYVNCWRFPLGSIKYF